MMNLKVKQALESIVQRFKEGDIPKAIAYSMFPIPNIPASKWSLLNRTLMFISGTSDARGFRQWNEVGRHVTKGAKSFTILAPRFIKKQTEDKEEIEPILAGFLAIPVFKVEDTEGEPLDYQNIELPELPLMEVAQEWGISVKAIPGNYQYSGYFSQNKREIGLASKEESVFFHELAHLAHQRIIGELKKGQDWKQEIVAELAAATLCSIVGKTSKYLGNSFQYIETYAKEAKLTPWQACLKVISDTERVLNLIMDWKSLRVPLKISNFYYQKYTNLTTGVLWSGIEINAEGSIMMQTGLLDWQIRFRQLDAGGDPLPKLKKLVDWERFRPDLEAVRDKERKSNAGRKPFDVVLMFKVLVLQSLYNLSDERIEFQIRDRISFMRFLGLTLGGAVPDEKTIWLFREQLTEAGLIKRLFEEFEAFLEEKGFSAKRGQIIDASIVEAPRQRNSREENRQIKAGQIPEDWSDQKKRQKDTDARWTRKNGQNHYGYKNHIDIDVKHKLIRGYEVTPASVHDSQVFEALLDEDNSSRDVWADSAYRSEEKLEVLGKNRFREHLQRKGCKHKQLTEREKRGNRTRSRIRSRVEHIFGVQAMRAGDLIIRTIGLIRAKAKIGLRNLAYNLDRFCVLQGV